MKSETQRGRRRWHAMKALWCLCASVPLSGLAPKASADIVTVTVTSTVAPYQFARVCVWEETMFLLARYTVAAAVFLSASAASAVEDAILSADQMLPACRAFITDNAPSDIDGVFQAGRCIGLMQGLGYPSRLFGVCPPDEVTLAQRTRMAVTYVEARPERMHEDFRALAVEAMQKAWPCK
jgi:Rap1a immunity proteins